MVGLRSALWHSLVGHEVKVSMTHISRPIFHGPLILPYILKTISCMNITLWDYESVWPDVWPQNKCRSLWPIFHGPVILPYTLKTHVWTAYFGIVSQYDRTFDLKINVGHCDLYFMVQQFCLILWRQDYESVWHDIWPKNKCRSLWPILHGPVILPYILKTVWYMNTILWDYETVWPDVWPQNVCSTCDLYFMVHWFCLIS